MILIIDNYDSFTYNLVQYLEELGGRTVVYRNDRITLDEVEKLAPERILISPGPCTPQQAGISMEVIRRFGARRPILGVCLGHQAIGAVYGGEVVRAKILMHGKTSLIHHRGQGLYEGLENPFLATRYHSLIVEPQTLPDCLEVTSWTQDGVVMGLRHRHHPVEGVQFHPESILTAEGKKLLANFLAGKSGGGGKCGK